MESQRNQIATLDGLRDVAALAVVIFHMTNQTNLVPRHHDYDGFKRPPGWHSLAS
jgi:peptidoglycan/LPS O-acetylase OafA/YrhL